MHPLPQEAALLSLVSHPPLLPLASTRLPHPHPPGPQPSLMTRDKPRSQKPRGQSRGRPGLPWRGRQARNKKLEALQEQDLSSQASSRASSPSPTPSVASTTSGPQVLSGQAAEAVELARKAFAPYALTGSAAPSSLSLPARPPRYVRVDSIPITHICKWFDQQVRLISFCTSLLSVC
jgi:hypothetical protein